jgi:Flp pilus assembly protein TadD
MGLVTMGRAEEAAALFAAFPAPGTAAALHPTAPVELIPLETEASFHQARGLALLASQQPQAALAALTDALALDPSLASARLERARVQVVLGDMQGALADTDVILAAHPKAEGPWNVRATMALRTGVPAMAASALDVSTQLWGSNATVWLQLGTLYSQLGQQERAEQAFAYARVLQPALPGLPPAGSNP